MPANSVEVGNRPERTNVFRVKYRFDVPMPYSAVFEAV